MEKEANMNILKSLPAYVLSTYPVALIMQMPSNFMSNKCLNASGTSTRFYVDAARHENSNK